MEIQGDVSISRKAERTLIQKRQGGEDILTITRLDVNPVSQSISVGELQERTYPVDW